MAIWSEAEFRNRYPDLSYLLDVPDLGGLLRQATEEEWPPEKFQARIMETDWWKTTSEATRAYDQLQATDPATHARKVAVVQERIRDFLTQMGMYGVISDEKMREMAGTALRLGWSDEELNNDIAAHLQYRRGAAGQEAIAQELRDIARDYGIVGLDDTFIGTAIRTIVAGSHTIEGYRATMREWARQLNPHLAEVFESGITLSQYVEPLRQQVAAILEVSPGDIDPLGDNRWKQLWNFKDETGAQRTMTMNEAAELARSQPEWVKTRNANDRAAQLTSAVRQTFTGS